MRSKVKRFRSEKVTPASGVDVEQVMADRERVQGLARSIYTDLSRARFMYLERPGGRSTAEALSLAAERVGSARRQLDELYGVLRSGRVRAGSAIERWAYGHAQEAVNILAANIKDDAGAEHWEVLDAVRDRLAGWHQEARQ
ncbi:hypothetical protein LRF89_12110 [Halorhodospira sp. 9621]|uniref:hypothetical protein n=1 Tax=Halorhodospira sp. 9621 TaxID=2899135 RepID=UPI001EE94FF3|nr:hypothetical protein [Halorhodospira sp. 9621]MCG5534178.1 hypothetical protein [Halorhodospira sp. 9621]